MQTLPWAKPFHRRCRARIDSGADASSGLFGRCELAPHSPDVEHALERGMVTVRWSSLVRWDGPDWSPGAAG